MTGRLSGVAAASARNAWAVGSTGSGKTLNLHWNGESWKRVPIPASDSLAAVAAVSPSGAWAVGTTSNGRKTLIDRWNGTAWK